MKIERRDGSVERKIIIGMITHPDVLGRISSKWKQFAVRSSWARTVGQWCVDFYIKYGKPPGKTIELIFAKWAKEEARDEDTIKLIERFLADVSGEYASRKKEINPSYLVDMALEHFRKVRVSKFKDELEELIDKDDVEEAEKKIVSYQKAQPQMSKVVDVLHDKETIKAAFGEDAKPVVTYNKALQNFFANTLRRSAFVSFVAPMKTKKSFWIQDICYRAAVRSRKVIIFQLGDMTDEEYHRERLMPRIAKKPLEPCTIRYPTSIEPSGEVLFKEIEFRHGLNWKKSWTACRSLLKKFKGERRFKLSCHPAKSLSVAGIHSILQDLELEDWVPDVIGLDYADLLVPSGRYKDKFEQIDDIWMDLRALSQTQHALVITATQANRGAFSKSDIDPTDVGGFINKLAHVSAMIGIMSDDTESENGVSRLNYVRRRSGKSSIDRHCIVAGCYEIANPAILSSF